jgi:hypothetical protein
MPSAVTTCRPWSRCRPWLEQTGNEADLSVRSRKANSAANSLSSARTVSSSQSPACSGGTSPLKTATGSRSWAGRRSATRCPIGTDCSSRSSVLVTTRVAKSMPRMPTPAWHVLAGYGSGVGCRVHPSCRAKSEQSRSSRNGNDLFGSRGSSSNTMASRTLPFASQAFTPVR